MKPFDYAAFKAGWRAGCAKYHIDPAAGPTSYSISNLTADQHKAVKNEQAALLTLAEVSEVLTAWLALGRWAWGVDLVEWGLIRDLLRTAIRLTTPRELPEALPAAVDPDTVSLIDFHELWHEVCEELRADMTPKQVNRLPTWREIREQERVLLPVPRALVVAS